MVVFSQMLCFKQHIDGFLLNLISHFIEFRQVKKLLSHFTDFKQNKEINSRFADLGQIKKSLLLC